jgi:hypothetical protein
MRDPFASSRLPDLPNAGYATKRERAVSDMIQEFIRQIERDRVALLDIVCSGLGKWRKVCAGVLRGARMETELVDAIYHYLTLLAGDHPAQQLQNLLTMQHAKPWLQQAGSEYQTPKEAEKAVRDSLAFAAAINRGDRSSSELVRKK